jgi:hypothetical protein
LPVGPTRLPLLCIEAWDAAGRAEAGRPEWRDALALALPNLQSADRARLAAILQDLGTRVEARSNPFAEDLFDGDPKDELVAWAKAHGPLVQAAASLATRSHVVGEGMGVVRLADRCADARGRTVWPSEDAPDDDLAKKARFETWALSYAMLLRIEDALARACVRRELRALVATGGPLALVVAGDEDQPPTLEELALFDRALPPPASPARGALAFEVGQTDLLAVPRLAALTELEHFADVVEERVRNACRTRLTVVHAAALP